MGPQHQRDPFGCSVVGVEQCEPGGTAPGGRGLGPGLERLHRRGEELKAKVPGKAPVWRRGSPGWGRFLSREHGRRRASRMKSSEVADIAPKPAALPQVHLLGPATFFIPFPLDTPSREVRSHPLLGQSQGAHWPPHLKRLASLLIYPPQHHQLKISPGGGLSSSQTLNGSPRLSGQRPDTLGAGVVARW